MSAHPSNPQAEQMADESMVRTLAAQAEAIWPQERPLLERLALPAGARILDLGCGTGEITARLGELFPQAELVGVDLDEAHLARARQRCAALGVRVSLRQGDALELDLPAHEFDLCVCRHLVQAVPDVPGLLRQIVRVTRPGGRLHLLAEDYGMIHFHPSRTDADRFFREVVLRFGETIGTDQAVGRKMYTLLAGLGMRDLAIDYVTVDTLRVPREVFAAIWTAWRDGYSAGLARASGRPVAEVVEAWNDMLECLRDPLGYAVWHVPIATAAVP